MFSFSERYLEYLLGITELSDFPEYAMNALVDGLDSENLVILAGFNKYTQGYEIEEYLRKTAKELLIPEYSETDIIFLLIKKMLQEISEKGIDPYDGMSYIDNLYSRLDKSIFSEGKFLGSELGLEKLYTWYRELQDWESESTLFYYNNLSRSEQRIKFLEELYSEALKWIESNSNKEVQDFIKK